MENQSLLDSLTQSNKANEQLLTINTKKKYDNELKYQKKNKTKNNSQLTVNLGGIFMAQIETKYQIVKRVLKNTFGMRECKEVTGSQWDLFWTDGAVQSQQLAAMKPFQKINHFPGMFTLSRKNYLARNLAKMSKQFSNEYDFYPQTWVLPAELNELKQYFQKQPNSIVIAKPEASSQGKGIFLSKQINDFQFGGHYVVQKYIKKPFLIEELKFDLRIYVVITGCDPLRLYIYKEGLGRFATEKYVTPHKENFENLFMHLTNYAINKVNSKFEYNYSKANMDQGHKRSLTHVLQRIQEMGKNSEQLWEKIKIMITKTLISVQPILSHHYRSCQPENYSNNMCFEILGFDVLIDENMNPFILEVNSSPSFGIDTPLDKAIKEKLIEHTVQLMNITPNTKKEVQNSKKKEIMERTLTGKKKWYTKEERDNIVLRAQLRRDNYENRNIGEFEKVYPVENIEQMQTYRNLLEFSIHSYLNLTGANVRRNVKIPLTPVITELYENQSNSEAAKLNKTKQLQKIYKGKFRPMLPKKIKNEKNKKSSEQSDKCLIFSQQTKQKVMKIQKAYDFSQIYQKTMKKSLKTFNKPINQNSNMSYKRPNSQINKCYISTVNHMSFKNYSFERNK